MDIITLKEKGLISLSAYDICLKYNLCTTVDLNKFLVDCIDITILEGCESDISDELISLAKKYNWTPSSFSKSTSINFLYNKGQVSYRTLTVCKENRLNNVGDIKLYLSNNHSFKRLKGCGSKTNEELLMIISLGGEDQLELFSVERETVIIDFYNKGEISVRAYNICVENNLNNLGELIDYKENYSDFYRLNRCGKKTNDELVNLANKEIKISNCKSDMEDKIFPKLIGWNSLLGLVNSLIKKDRDSINNFIKFVLSSLSSRSQKYIAEYYAQDLRVKRIVSMDRLIDSNTNIKIGSKYYQDIDFFYEQVLENIILDRSVRENLIEQFLEILLYGSKEFNRGDLNIDIDNYSGLQIIDFLIKEGVMFGERSDIFLECLNIYDDFRERTLEEVGNDFGLTRERIRQLRVKGLERLDEVLKGIRDIFSREIYSDWDSDNTDIIELTNSTIEGVNNKYNVSFSKEFIAYLYSICSQNKVLIPEVTSEHLANIKGKGVNSFDRLYLLDKNTYNKLNFVSLIDEIKLLNKSRIEEGYNLDLNNFIDRYLYDGEELDESLIRSAEDLIMKESGVFVNEFSELEFKRNISKTVPDYAYEILKEIGKPSKIDLIYDLLLEKYPDFDRSENTFRGSFNADIRFVPLGRQSIWGLKEWEHERDDFLGGTMLEMTENILKNSDLPLHISDISEKISRYRDVDCGNLMSNLKFNNQRGFVFFKKQYVGLDSKDYPDEFSVLERLDKENRTWDESYLSLLSFVELYGRIPKASDDFDEAPRTYRWYGIQRKKYLDNKLSEDRDRKIESVITYYDNRSQYE